MKKLWTDRAWDEYLTWQEQDKKTIRKVNKLIRDIERNPFEGLGKANCKRAYNGTGTEPPI